MNIFLAIQNTYDEIQLAVMQGNQLLDSRSLSKMKASALFIHTLQELLEHNSIVLKDIPFIAVNQGPGPFTTLRVVIASANGLSFATQIPLVGIDGLKAFIREYESKTYPNTVLLLNAFSQDVYFAIQSDDTIQTGYHNIDALLEQIKHTIPNQTVRFLGNGTQMHEEKIKALLGENAYIPDPLPLACSVEQIGKMGFEQWQQNHTGVHQLLPLYLKKHPMQQ